MATDTTGLTTLPKLKYEHIDLNNFSKMRVDVAAKVYLLVLYMYIIQVQPKCYIKLYNV